MRIKLVATMLGSILLFTACANKTFDNEMISKVSNEVKNQQIYSLCSEYVKSGHVSLYEYTDRSDILSSLERQYFVENTADTSIALVNEYLFETVTEENDVSNIVDALYYLYHVCNKNNASLTNLSINLEELVKRMNLLYKDELTYLQLMRKIKKIAEYKDSGSIDKLATLFEIPKDSYAEIDEEILVRLLRAEDEGNSKVVADIFSEIKGAYLSGKIETVTFLLALDIIPKALIDEMDDYYFERVYWETVDFIHSYPSQIRFVICRLFEQHDYNNFNEVIDRYYLSYPADEYGRAPVVATIVPSYRRAFQFDQICKMNGMVVDKATFYEYMAQVEEANSPSELYYKYMLSKNYQDIVVDEEAVKKAIDVLEMETISGFNYMEFFYGLLLAKDYDMDSKSIWEKLQMFNSSFEEDNILFDVLNALVEEIALGEIKTTSLRNLATKVEGYQGEGDIETVFYYIWLERLSGDKKLLVKESLKEKTDAYLIEKRPIGGYWANEEFKYPDIARTYEAMYISEY